LEPAASLPWLELISPGGWKQQFSAFFVYCSFQNALLITLPLLSSYEENLLLREVSNGNEKAFRTVYDLYFNRLSAYIFKLCKSETATEEIVQDIFVKLWVSRVCLAEVTSPESYIFATARNKTIDYLRRLARETDLIGVLKGQLQLYNNDIEDKLNASELKRLIEEALVPLSAQKKSVFRLSKNEGLSLDEIAVSMHLSKSTVKNHLSETLRHVRDHLRQHPNSEALMLILAIIFSK